MPQNFWLSIMISLLVAQLGSISYAYFQFLTRERGHFYEQLPNGDTFELTELDRPNVSTKALLEWVSLAATATFTFDFVNYEKQLTALRDFFTADGYINFLASLEASKTITTVSEKNLQLSAVAIGPAIVLIEQEISGYHTWRIQGPLLVRYQSASVNETHQQIVTMLVTQVPTSDAPKGIGIAQYVAQEATSDTSST
jgi:intracellular multiplication protein IcmL